MTVLVPRRIKIIRTSRGRPSSRNPLAAPLVLLVHRQLGQLDFAVVPVGRCAQNQLIPQPDHRPAVGNDAAPRPPDKDEQGIGGQGRERT